MALSMKAVTVATVLTILAGSGVTAHGADSENAHHRRLSSPTGFPAAKIGTPAPAFTLEAVAGEEFRKIALADHRGKWVVLLFYPLDFSSVCPTEIRGFNAALGRFRELNAEVLAVSVDSKFSHRAWIQRGDLGKLGFPLLSDLTKEVARSYGILDDETGVAQRGLFIIDPQGVIQYIVVHNGEVGRSVDEPLRVLEALQTGELCPLGWKPGHRTLRK